MRSQRPRWILVVFLVGTLTQTALAGLLGPFSFTFANSLMNNLFLLPFRLGGCV